MKNDTTLEIENLKKQFFVDETGDGFLGSIKALFHRRKKTINALEGISFSVNKGEFVGYVGENGAGKSTTIKILTGILCPTSGVVRVNGIVPYENRQVNAMKIGVVFGQRTQLWWDLPVRESFEMLKAIYRIEHKKYSATLKRLIETLDLSPLLMMPVRKLSLGQRMRCDLAASLIHMPPILFLDEPTIGLDVLAKENIRNFLIEINKNEGTTIILTTHDMNDIEHLCRRLVILDKGKIIFDDSKEALKKRFVQDKILEVEFHQPVESLSKISELTVTREQGNKKWLKFHNNGQGIADIIAKLARHYPVKDLSVREPSVENIIRSIYARNLSL